jgi:tripartite-type tricarboxylate transporter receptor subunit TctC
MPDMCFGAADTSEFRLPERWEKLLKISMRRWIAWGLFGVSVMGAPAIGICQVYPVKPIPVLVGFPAGGAADMTPRIPAPAMGEALRQQMVIDNRGGAHGNIATEIVVNARPDGYTLLFGTLGRLHD